MDADIIRIMDCGQVIEIRYENCIQYAGRDSIGGVALGFRLMQRAIRDLSPGIIPERKSFKIRTCFPGPGTKDAVEFITRAVTRGEYLVDQAFLHQAPEAVIGRLGFEVTIGDATARYVTMDGAMSEEFIRIGRLNKTDRITFEEKLRWTQLKESLARTLMDTPTEVTILRLE